MCTKDEKENIKKIDDVDFQVLKLTDLFYDTYPSKKYPEILVKKQRGYNCLLIQSHYDYFICVPFRSDIRHKYAFLFKDTVRSKKHSSGLDYTKSIIVKNPDYITSYDAVIDKDEYMKTQKYIDKIKEEVLKYIDEYVLHMNNIKVMDQREFLRKYKMSTLKYFHTELQIKEAEESSSEQ